MRLQFCLPLLIAFLFVACNSRSDMGHTSMSPEMAAGESMDYKEMERSSSGQSANQNGDGSASLPPEDRKIIKTADIRCEVNNLESSTAKIESQLAGFKAYVSNVEFSSSSYSLENQLTIRVPADQFDTLLKAIGEEALYVDYKRINARDVTEEYLDIETRLQTKKEVRDRYIDILRNKAKTVEEILMAEEKIRVIQEEIESREGRLRYLKNQVQLSTIRLSLYEKLRGSGPQQPGFFQQLVRSLANGWEVFLDFLLGLAAIWPLLLLGLGAIWGIRRFWRRRK